MKRDNTIYLLKLGGSLLTDKNKPLSLREDVINSTIEQIIESNKKIVLIHGGGSFGHPIAKNYQLSEGLNTSIKNQVLGLSKTHEAMNKLNTIIINKFLKKNYPVLSISPSTIFIKRSQQFVLNSTDPIEISLRLGVLPILYGDIVLEKDGSFSIISGDDIILELCKTLKYFEVEKVIFAIEKDGIYVKDGGNIEFASEINFDELKSIELAELEHKIDVTGGIGRKFEIIKQIAELNIPVQIINGLKKNHVLKSLKNQKFVCTNISLSKEKVDSQAIHTRKLEHLTIPLDYNVQSTKNYFDEIILIHHPLPELELHDVELETQFFKKSVSAPICIAAITGGHPISKKINKILAQAAESEKIIMSVGSQRIALEDQSAVDSFQIVRECAPNIPIIGNLGIGQISSDDFQLEEFQKCIEMINADIMAIHFNALHELVQKEGNIYYTAFYDNFKKVRERFKIPIIAKEVGAGFNRDLALQLDLMGFDGFDIGGMGGTNFTSIESIRNNDNTENYTRKLADTLKNWGIPTPISILNVRSTSKKPIVATGGLRTGLDIAKSIVLGADIGGFAYKFLQSAWKDYKQKTITNTINEIRTLKHELRSVMWLINIDKIENLKSKREKSILLGDMYKWANQ
ncbi:MAG: type 2 isopentenyl-diphosphate Delta-isomerase [Candidatus Hermodarchaeota archaeon]